MIRRALFAAALAAACTPVPRPEVLEEVDRTRQAGAAQEAAALAPQAFLYAEKLRGDADQAFHHGDRAGSQILGERALAAYTHASVLARLAKAEERNVTAKARLEKAERDQALLDEDQRRVAAEADDVEARVKVAREALPLSVSEAASPERERARLAAARAIATEARLLCVATQMLVPDTAGVTDAFKALDTLDAELAKSPLHPSIDAAVRLRSACLAELSKARRPAAASAPEASSSDALLDELGKAGDTPSRDDRGVVVVLRGAFQGAVLKPSARDEVTALGQVAKAHPTFPVLVVSHARDRVATAQDTEHAEAIAKLLADAGAPHVLARNAGPALPVLPAARAADQNERVEVVFVSPAL